MEGKFLWALLKYQTDYHRSILSKLSTKRWVGSLSKALLSLLHIMRIIQNTCAHPKKNSGLDVPEENQCQAYGPRIILAPCASQKMTSTYS